MAVKQPCSGKKYFTVAEANATLPLVRAIVRDITELARDLQDRHERLARFGRRSTPRWATPTRKNCSRSRPSSSATRNGCTNTSRS